MIGNADIGVVTLFHPPPARRGAAERLLEAANRKLRAEPDPATLDRLREIYLALNGGLEGE